MFELKVKIKGDDQVLNKKFLIYDEDVQLSHDDKTLRRIVEDTLKDFKGTVEDVLLTIKLTW